MENYSPKSSELLLLDEKSDVNTGAETGNHDNGILENEGRGSKPQSPPQLTRKLTKTSTGFKLEFLGWKEWLDFYFTRSA